jgi:hypothetical protein
LSYSSSYISIPLSISGFLIKRVLEKLANAPAVAAIIVFINNISFPIAAEANPFVKYLK